MGYAHDDVVFILSNHFVTKCVTAGPLNNINVLHNIIYIGRYHAEAIHNSRSVETTIFYEAAVTRTEIQILTDDNAQTIDD